MKSGKKMNCGCNEKKPLSADKIIFVCYLLYLFVIYLMFMNSYTEVHLLTNSCYRYSNSWAHSIGSLRSKGNNISLRNNQIPKNQETDVGFIVHSQQFVQISFSFCENKPTSEIFLGAMYFKSD